MSPKSAKLPKHAAPILRSGVISRPVRAVHTAVIPMSNKSLYLELIDLGETAERIADVLLRERNHSMHRIGVVPRDVSLTIAQVLTDDVNKRLAELN
jgi:hypothetical protein